MSLFTDSPSTPRARRRLTLLALSATIVTATPALAEPAPTYEALVARAAAVPSLLEADAGVAAAEARVRQAGVRPNPELTLDVENALGSGPYGGIGGAETTLSLSQDLELFGRRGARVDLARAEQGVAEARRQVARVDLPTRIAIAYAEAEAAQRRAVLAREALDLAIADTRAALALVEAGREPILRGIQAESEAAGARAAYDAALAERDASFAQLTAIVASPTRITSIPESLLDRVPARPNADLGATNGAVITLEAERAAAERRIRVEQIRGRPNVRANAGIRRFEADSAFALVGGVAVQLPLFDDNRGNVAAATADLRGVQARLQAARLDAEAAQQGARARLAASASRVSAADDGVRAATEAYRLTRIGFEEGRLSALELRSTRTVLVQARSAAIEARLSRTRAEAELARLEGRRPFGTTS